MVPFHLTSYCYIFISKNLKEKDDTVIECTVVGRHIETTQTPISLIVIELNYMTKIVFMAWS